MASIYGILSIDAVVDEYRQQVEVKNSGPLEKVLRIPSMESWRLSMVLIVFYLFGVFICIFAFAIESVVIFSGGALGKFKRTIIGNVCFNSMLFFLIF